MNPVTSLRISSSSNPINPSIVLRDNSDHTHNNIHNNTHNNIHNNLSQSSSHGPPNPPNPPNPPQIINNYFGTSPSSPPPRHHQNHRQNRRNHRNHRHDRYQRGDDYSCLRPVYMPIGCNGISSQIMGYVETPCQDPEERILTLPSNPYCQRYPTIYENICPDSCPYDDYNDYDNYDNNNDSCSYGESCACGDTCSCPNSYPNFYPNSCPNIRPVYSHRNRYSR